MIPSNSFLFKEKLIENQQQLGDEIIATFENKYASSDTIFLVTERFHNIDCGTGVKTSIIDGIKFKYYKLKHKNILQIENVFATPLKKTEKIVLTKIETYTNEQIPNNSDYMIVNGKTITNLKSNKTKVFILNFDAINSDTVQVSFTDYLKNTTAFHFTFVLKNGKWKNNNT
ncbi:hypothetical protein [Flavobacterium pectinovorum]|uniref:Uncharacterized protein n=1 Tax=Flavobacterium pectinovorum TaxID=29533 RepID=A0A502EZG0_9FLAO|nr:hypothetical protein [Flavobacterium pectinovorum]TPG41561.1 hypothetical protein EAH81_08740 [Flavobacterium pectinovorum]